MGRPRTDRKVTRISVSLDDQDYRALREIADQNDVSAAWIIRRALADYLQDKPRGQGSEFAQMASR